MMSFLGCVVFILCIIAMLPFMFAGFPYLLCIVTIGALLWWFNKGSETDDR